MVSVGFARGKPHYPPPQGPRVATHRWRVDLRFDLQSWKYMDGKFLTFQGVCNAQVGRGNRAVTFHASFPDVKYQRFGKLEVLGGKSTPYRCFWSPRVGQGRFQWPHTHLGSPPREENCGHGLLAGHLVGLEIARPTLTPAECGRCRMREPAAPVR